MLEMPPPVFNETPGTCVSSTAVSLVLACRARIARALDKLGGL
jgi:hypothetical protein